MMQYQHRKEAARQEAIDWQVEFSEHNYSYDELVVFQEHFTQIGRRFGLLTEFRENGVI